MRIDRVRIPAGEFIMGKDDLSEDAPSVRMVISKPFWMSKTLITQKQWFAVMRSRPWQTALEEDMEAEGFVEKDSCPAVCVTKVDAEDFAKKLSKKAGKKYALPTEVQWEYAYRGGTTTRYFWGDALTDFRDYAWCREEGKPWPDGLQLQEVAMLKPNPWGLFDMAGLVQEFVRDQVVSKGLSLANDHYPDGGVDFWSKKGPSIILRNGCYVHSTNYATAWFKLIRSPKSKSNAWGFRVVCDEE